MADELRNHARAVSRYNTQVSIFLMQAALAAISIGAGEEEFVSSARSNFKQLAQQLKDTENSTYQQLKQEEEKPL